MLYERYGVNREAVKNQKKKLREIKKFNARMYAQYSKEKRKKRVPKSQYETVMEDKDNILELDELKVYFYTDTGTVKAVDGVSFSIPKGKTIAVVGESGCGKSVTSLSVMGLLKGPEGQVAGGAVRYSRENWSNAWDLTRIPSKEMEKIRGREISMIFQEPMTALNPVFTIGFQLGECIYNTSTEKMSKKEVKKRVLKVLKSVGIDREGIYDNYPHELSGGMRQRIVIAMAICANPRLIIADEPTTALDVTIQAQILDLLRNLKKNMDASIMLITHDLGVVAEMADYVVVMYAGRVVEKGGVREIFHHPAHPYTVGLMKSRPMKGRKTQRLYSIPGSVPNPVNLPPHCYFKNRCADCMEICEGPYPEMRKITDTHYVSCYRDCDTKEGDKKDEEV